MKTRLFALFLVICMLAGMTACGSKDDGGEAPAGDNILRTAASFAYPSLDVHKEYYGWYTSIYGLSESLFRFDENAKSVPCLAEDAVTDEVGTTWTITLKDGVTFSNGDPLTADMVIRNLQRIAEVNSRFAYFGDYTYEAPDEKTIIIHTGDKVYPMLRNDLTSQIGRGYLMDRDGKGFPIANFICIKATAMASMNRQKILTAESCGFWRSKYHSNFPIAVL